MEGVSHSEATERRRGVSSKGGGEGAREGGRDGEGGRASSKRRLNRQEKIKVSPHNHKVGFATFLRRHSRQKASFLISSLERHNTKPPAGPRRASAEKTRAGPSLFFQKCSFQPDKFKHSDLEAPAAPAGLTRPRQQEDNNLSRNKIEMSSQSG